MAWRSTARCAVGLCCSCLRSIAAIAVTGRPSRHDHFGRGRLTFVLFLYTDVVWPLYWFILLGIVHMYATVFTRGAALGSAAWFLVATAGLSTAWAAARGHLHPTGEIGFLIDAALRILPFVAWLLVTAYMFLLGRRSISRSRLPAATSSVLPR